MAPSAPNCPVLRFGTFEIHLTAGELRKNGLKIKLQAQPFQVLALLIERRGEAVTHEELRQKLWPADTFVDFEHSIGTAIKKIRQALGDSATNPRFVETLPKLGYRFIAPVGAEVTERLEGPAAPLGNRKLWYAGAAALAVVVVLVFVAVGRFSRPRGGEPSSTPLLPIPVTTDPGRELSPSLSPDGRQVAFAGESEGQPGLDIYMKLIGSGARLQLTTHPANDLSPAWSPDGRTIAFMRQSGEGEFDLYLIPALGGPEQKIYELDAHRTINWEAGPLLAWSPDGRWLAVRCRTEPPGGSGLCLLSPQTRELRPLTTPGMEFLGDTSPAFSPDGGSLAFVRQDRFQGGSLYILDLDDDLRAAGEPVRLTAGNRWVASPVWTSEGSEVIFSAAEETESNFALWRIRALSGSKATPFFPLASRSVLSISKGNSSNRARLVYTMQVSDNNIWKVQLPGPGEKIAPGATPLLASTRTDEKPQFSPDGRRIAFVSRRSGPAEVWLCDSDGSNIRPLTNLGATVVGPPRWSPDGRRIVFHARLQGKAEVYVIAEGGGLPRRLTTGAADEDFPNWSRDGRRIYFSRRVDGKSQLWKRPAEGGEAIQLTSQGGFVSFEASDGRTVYYSKGIGVMGVFQMPVAERLLEGPESRLLDSVIPSAFCVARKRLYFIEGKVDHYGENLKYLDLTSGRVFMIAPIHHPVYVGLTVSPDSRTLLYTQIDLVNSDLMMLDEFQ